jgi:DNA modification methylase
MKIEKIAIDKLLLDPANARKHGKKNLDSIKGSLAKFGQQKPIVVNADNVIVAGNGTMQAAKELGWKEINIVRTDLKGSDITAFGIADNRTSELAEWDDKVLQELLEGLKAEDFDLSAIGFDIDDMNEMIGDKNKVGLTDPDDVPEPPKVPITKLGDIWQLGNHRLMCGDSTDANSVALLMDGKKADITFTSPPYNAANSPTEKDGSGKYVAGKNSDNKATAEYVSFLDKFTVNSLKVSDYVFSNIQSISNNKVALLEHLYNLKNYYADVMIWKKGAGQPAMARRVLNSAFEFIYIFSNEGTRAIGKKDFRGTIPNVFELSPNAGKEFAKIHKATFRVELPEMFIEWFVETSVYEPFCGTGTTLIACEKASKKCYGMELEPIYCDVIIKRWEDFTGKKAVLINEN